MTSLAASVERQWAIPGYSPWIWALSWDTSRQQCFFLNLLSGEKVPVIQSSGNPKKYPDLFTRQCPWLSAPEEQEPLCRGIFQCGLTCPTCSAQLLHHPPAEAPLLWPSWLGPAGSDETWTYGFHKEFSCICTTVDGGFGWLFLVFPQHDAEKLKANVSLPNTSVSAEVCLVLSLIKLHLNVFSFSCMHVHFFPLLPQNKRNLTWFFLSWQCATCFSHFLRSS